MIRAAHHVTLPRFDEKVNGDAVVVRDEGSVALLSIVDGLGHGDKAADAARKAVEELSEVALSMGVLSIVMRLHEKLHGSRGAAALVCLLRASNSRHGVEIEGCSVGNVEMRCQSSKIPFMLSPGVLGARVRAPRVFSAKMAKHDRVVLFSDGISPRFSLADFCVLSPSEVCHAIFERHRRQHDDSTVLVADLEE